MGSPEVFDDRAFLAGERARKAGEPRASNPNPVGSSKRRSWDDGWLAGYNPEEVKHG